MTVQQPAHEYFGGYLFSWREGLSENVRWEALPGVEAAPLDVIGWWRLKWLAPPIKHGQSHQLEPHFLFRRGGARRFLLLARDPDAIPVLLEHYEVLWRVTSPPVDVHKVVQNLVSTPGEYALGAVWARTEGYGTALESVGFYGKDVAEAGMFRELLPTLSCTQVRLRDVRRGMEVLLVGHRGKIGLHYRNAESLREADEALRFLSRRRYVIWEGSVEDQT